MKISVLLPYYNEEQTITKSLVALLNQTKVLDEVIFIDSGSTDTTSKIIDAWISDNMMTASFKNIYSGKMSPSSSINKGIDHANGDIIGYIDCGLNIPLNWYENLSNYIVKDIAEIVSCSIYTDGVGLTDKSLISQTYGYKNKRACLTGSIINKKVFDQIGVFIPDVRAGYDVDFINRIKKSNIKRTVIYDYPLKYYSTNYAKTYLIAFKKVFNYSLSALKAEGDHKPLLYFFFSLLLFIIKIEILILFYIIIRGIAIPVIKSNYKRLSSEPYIFFLLPLSGLVIDSARVFGYIYAMFNFLRSLIPK